MFYLYRELVINFAAKNGLRGGELQHGINVLC